jgi:uncharacterized protein
VIIRQSFVLLDRITLDAERRIWQQGIKDWKDFRQRESILRISNKRKGFYDLQLLRLEQQLKTESLASFFDLLPISERWRLFPLLKENALYIDIETAQRYGDITVLGAWDGKTYYSFVKGCNLDKDLVRDLFSRYRLFITFNGSSFDLPIIERYFGGVLPEGYLHIDLRHLLARLGFEGGLKSIELQLGITRPEEISSMTGADAAILWHEFLLTQDAEMVELLLEYNAADCRNLEPLAEYAVAALWSRIRAES